MKRRFSKSLILLILLVAGAYQAGAQCTGPLSVSVTGSGTGSSLSASETHINALCPNGFGSVTIAATGGTTPYTGTGTFTQAVGTQQYTVTDMFGCMSTVSVTITFTDAVPPSITCPANVTVNPDPGLCTASGVMLGMPMTNDNCGVLPATSNAPSIFSLAVTSVTWTVYDISGNSSSCTQTVTLTPCLTISGNVRWENNNSPVKDVTAGLYSVPGSTLLGTNVTGVSGAYTLNAGPSGSYSVVPTKNINLLNGVTSADATRIQQHITSSPALNGPYKRIAADINKSNSITTIDAQLITQALAGSPTALAYFNNCSWRFVPASYVFPNPLIPWGFPEKINLTGITSSQVNQNFIGVKLGDVNGTANPLLKLGPPVLWTAADQQLNSGETVSVTFHAGQFSDIAACQFALSFDPAKLQYESVLSSGTLALNADNFGAYNVENGEFRWVWNTDLGKTLVNGASVFTIKFKVLESGGLLSEVVHLDEQNFPAVAYTTELVETGVALIFTEEVLGTKQAQHPGLQLLQNRPNPFNGPTIIGFMLPAACEAQLRIFDVNGRLITETKKSYPAGYQQEKFDLKEASGVMYYELTTPFGVLSKKMLGVRL